MTYYLFPKTFIVNIVSEHIVIPDIINNNVPYMKEWFSPSLHYYLSNILQQLQKIKTQYYIPNSIDHLSNTYHLLCNYSENRVDSSTQTDPKTISKINVGGMNQLFFYELLELFQTVHLSMDMHSPIRIFVMGEGNMNISALQSIHRMRNNSARDNYFLFGSKPLDTFLKDTPLKMASIHMALVLDKETNSEHFTLSNLNNCISKYESSMELIISDAILPMITRVNKLSEDFIQDQEYQTTRIAMLQVCFALCMQKKNGVFILKMGDCFSPLSLDLICILSSFYNKTYFTKPTVSDSSSSGRFIVCKGFVYDQIKDYHSVLINIFDRVLSSGLFTDSSSTQSTPYLSRFIQWNIPKLFVVKIEEINSIFGQTQLEQLQHIHSVLTHKYKQDKINHFTKSNTQKCIQWCIKYKIPFRNS